MVYTLSRAIKEERKNEERVGSLESKREQGWQIKKKSEEKKRERRFRGVEFLVFSFLFKGVSRENILKEGEGGFLCWKN